VNQEGRWEGLGTIVSMPNVAPTHAYTKPAKLASTSPYGPPSPLCPSKSNRITNMLLFHAFSIGIKCQYPVKASNNGRSQFVRGYVNKTKQPWKILCFLHTYEKSCNRSLRFCSFGSAHQFAHAGCYLHKA
jgi:hypothetical protein